MRSRYKIIKNVLFEVKNNNYLKLGQINESTYTTYRGPEHFFRRYNSFGISAEVIKLLLKHNVKIIRISYSSLNSHIQYIFNIKDLLVKNLTYDDNYPTFKDKQYHYPIKEMCKI